MSVMTKRILVNLPAKLYEDLKREAKREYKTISGMIRESIVEKLGEKFTAEEADIIKAGLKEAAQGKGVSWRKIKRG